MKTSILTLAMALALNCAYAQSENNDLRAQLQKHYRQFDDSIRANDFQAFISLFHPSYSEVDTQGRTRNFAQFKSLAKGMFDTQKDGKATSTVVHAQGGFGGEATAWVSVTMHFSTKVNGKWAPMKLTKRYADTLKRTSLGWKFAYSQELPIDDPWPF